MSPLEQWLRAHHSRYAVGAGNSLPPLQCRRRTSRAAALDALWWRLVDEAGLVRMRDHQEAA